MIKECETCGAVITKGDYCIYCKSQKTNCNINARGYKEMSIGVPWCFEKDERLTHLDWCRGCEYNKEGKYNG